MLLFPATIPAKPLTLLRPIISPDTLRDVAMRLSIAMPAKPPAKDASVTIVPDKAAAADIVELSLTPTSPPTY